MSNYSTKQLDVIRNIGKVPNEIHVGVYGCGKTFSIMVALGLLCMRLQNKGVTGLTIVFLGKTQQSVKKNMCNVLSSQFGSNFRYDGSRRDGVTKDAVLFGQYIIIAGTNDRSSETKIRGLSQIFCIVHDEAVLATEDQFNKIKSRLRCSYNKKINDALKELGVYNRGFYIASTNPDSPHHWLKGLIDNHYFDVVVNWSVEDAAWDGAKEYYADKFKLYAPGTIDRARYLECKWVASSGVVFRNFIEHKDQYIIKTFNQMDVGYAMCGLDVGGNKSGSSFVITGYHKNRTDGLIVLVSKKLKHNKGEISPDKLYDWVIQCIKEFYTQYKSIPILELDVDCAEQYIENGCREAIRKAGYNISVGDSLKGKIMDRVKFIQRMFSIGGLHILSSCTTLIDSLSEICYDEKKSVDTLLDDGTTDNDSFDAFCYSFTKRMTNYNVL